MVNDQRPPVLNSQVAKVLVNPAGPHQRAKRAGLLIAAKTCSTGAGTSREVSKVFMGYPAKISTGRPESSGAGSRTLRLSFFVFSAGISDWFCPAARQHFRGLHAH